MKEKETDPSNQASSLEELIAEVEQEEIKQDHEDKETSLRLGSDKEIKIDVLSLPPRSEIHISNKRTRIRISNPMKRFIFMIVLLVILIVGSMFYFREDLLELFTP